LNPWQQEEVRTALDRAVRENQEFCLIPVLLPGAKRPGESELYDGIKNRHWVQFINSVEEEGAWQRLIGGLQDRQTGHLLFFCNHQVLGYRQVVPRHGWRPGRYGQSGTVDVRQRLEHEAIEDYRLYISETRGALGESRVSWSYNMRLKPDQRFWLRLKRDSYYLLESEIITGNARDKMEMELQLNLSRPP
jgi:hypothetical protein